MEKQPKSNPDKLSPDKVRAILDTPTPLHQLATSDALESGAIINTYDQHIMDALRTKDPDAEQLEVDNDLQARFIRVSEAVKDLPPETASGPILAYTPDSVIAAYSSKVTAHLPNPGDFMKAMQPESGPPLTEAANDRLNTLAQAIYGERFTSYQNAIAGNAPETTGRISDEQLARNRAEDLEILGHSHGIKRLASDTARRTVNFFTNAWAGTKNALTSPRLFVREAAYNSAKHKHQRLVAKINPNSSSALNRYRQAKADKQEQKVVTRLEHRNEVKDKMDARTDAARHHTEVNNSRHQEKVEQYKERKQAAVAHKELRKALRAEGASRKEARAIVGELTPGQLQRVGKVACQHNGALRIEKQVAARVAYAESHKAYLEESLDTAANTERSLIKLSEELTWDAHELYEQALPNITGQIEAKQHLLGSFSPGTHDYISIQHDIYSLQEQERRLQRRMEEKQRRAQAAERQAKAARRRQEQLRAKVAAQKKRMVEREKQLRKQQAISDERHQRKAEAIKSTLNGN